MREKVYVNYLTTTQYFALDHACKVIADAYRMHIQGGLYLVGSCLERKDFRDVDVRAIVEDSAFSRLFPSLKVAKLASVAFSEWLSMRTGMNVDFQFQERTDANSKYDGRRDAIGFGWQRSEYMPATTLHERRELLDREVAAIPAAKEGE